MSDPISELLFRLAGIPEDEPAECPEEKSCPSLARFATGIRLGWTDAEKAHACDCPACQKTAVRFWRLECPSPAELGAFVTAPARFPFRQAIEIHTADGCRRCALLLMRLRAESALDAAAAWVAAKARVLAAYVTLPNLSPALAAAAGEERAFSFEQHFTDPILRLELAQRQGNAVLVLDSPDRSLAGARFRVEIAGEGEAVTQELELADNGERGVSAERSLGPMVRLLDALGGDCTVLLHRLDG